MNDEDVQPSRRDALTGAMLIAALSALPATAPALSEEQAEDLPDDGGEFVMIDGWVFRRDDLPA